MRVVSGIQPSGPTHLGNYLGAIEQFLDLQTAAAEALYFIADLHALTTVHDGQRLHAASLSLAADLVALGLDPERVALFRQSDIPEVPALAWLLATVTPVGLLERGHAYKDKLARGLSGSAGLLTYPVLMAADILLYDADAVPVGADQQQHLEIAREIGTKLNRKLGALLVKPPRALVKPAVAIVPGLDGTKMSKSYGNTLDLFADEAELRRRIMGIQTDSTPVEAPKPLGSPLLALLELLSSPEEAEEHRRSWSAGGVGYAAYKHRLADRLVERFSAARAQRRRLSERPELLESSLRRGAERARAIAREVWGRVSTAAGIGSPPAFG
jgi:tryptophanyl-tRNA synthetase